MGNVMSEEEEDQFLEEGFNFESPDADQKINYGTAAPNWQHKEESEEEVGHEVDLAPGETAESRALSAKHRRDSNLSAEGSSTSMEDRRKRQHLNESNQQQPEPMDPKKMSYIQMAKIGYQELVNAIIRPPRADYKVSFCCCSTFVFIQ
jgi:hypothetical protein